MTRLVAAHQQLVVDIDGRLDTKSEDGLIACSHFLEAMEASSRALNLAPATRSYRDVQYTFMEVFCKVEFWCFVTWARVAVEKTQNDSRCSCLSVLIIKRHVTLV